MLWLFLTYSYFLGLRTLTVIDNALKEIKRNHNLSIDFKNIDYNDEKIFNLLKSGKTDGVFQLESKGMKAFIKNLSPSSLEDVIAGISLFRPGPMDFIPKYIEGKNNRDNISYTHPMLESILKPTYGCIVYQEQVMEIVRKLAGYSMGRSDLLRRVMSKKKTAEMEKERLIFIYGSEENNILGCIKNGVDKASAEKIFDEMVDFAKYAFNKSHAACYAIIGYQTAYLKCYYKQEFMAALMSSVMDGSGTKVSMYIEDCKRLSINLLSPCINESFDIFTVTKNGIRFGLLAIKNVGRNIILSIIDEREQNGNFYSLTEFIDRMQSKDLNKRAIESLIKAGAFDSLGGKRKQYMSIYKNVLDGASLTKKKNIEGQLSFFSILSDQKDLLNDNFINEDEYNLKQLLAFEKEVIGLYITGHPLSEYMDTLKNYITSTSISFNNEENELLDRDVKIVGGIITRKSVKYTSSNKTMAFIELEDLYGTIEVILFPNVYDRYLENIVIDEVVLIKGRVSIREGDDPKLICNEMTTFSELKSSLSKMLYLKIKKNDNINYDDILDVLRTNPGDTPVCVYDEKVKKILKVSSDCFIDKESDEKMIIELRKLLGKDSVVYNIKK